MSDGSYRLEGTYSTYSEMIAVQTDHIGRKPAWIWRDRRYTGGYMFDLYTRYPDRALTTFDTGHVEAIRRAHDLAGGHRMLLSSNLDFPWISALFALRPDPPSHAVSGSINQDDERRRLASLSILQGTPEQLDAAATSGDVLVLAPSDHHPAGAVLVDMVSVTVDTAEPFAVEPTTRPTTVVLVDIWRR